MTIEMVYVHWLKCARRRARVQRKPVREHAPWRGEHGAGASMRRSKSEAGGKPRSERVYEWNMAAHVKTGML
jgi:hypothetical protein